MLNSAPSVATTPSDDEAVDRIVEAGPRGALVLAGIATAIVVLIWFAFYLFVFVPRGAAL
ncbi:hypothetical protein SAMN05216548_107112 [Faunimonas pinastri]|uniref:Uncharacterized protein n=1 Tax=Faunimonas pinastri TaxID=1855383 RepID=A0A1H9II94_9HYPH|nr:hypothetical protein [Faunimonas pinastri]SEQ74192.1 hypothetical protein SAMN05216548_107112 [Faunimonas pinastri]